MHIRTYLHTNANTYIIKRSASSSSKSPTTKASPKSQGKSPRQKKTEILSKVSPWVIFYSKLKSELACENFYLSNFWEVSHGSCTSSIFFFKTNTYKHICGKHKADKRNWFSTSHGSCISIFVHRAKQKLANHSAAENLPVLALFAFQKFENSQPKSACCSILYRK